MNKKIKYILMKLQEGGNIGLSIIMLVIMLKVFIAEKITLIEPNKAILIIEIGFIIFLLLKNTWSVVSDEFEG